MAIRIFLLVTLMFFSIHELSAQLNEIKKGSTEIKNITQVKPPIFKISDTATKNYLNQVKNLKNNPVFYEVNHQIEKQRLIDKKNYKNEFVPINESDGNRAQLVKIKNPLGVGEPIVNALRIGNKVIYHGDILLDVNSIVTDTSEANFSDFVKNIYNNFWLDGIIPYEFNSDLDSEKKSKILEAIHEINSTTKLKLNPRKDSERPFLRFNSTQEGCYSDFVGLKGGNDENNNIYISENCEKGNVLHEILHVAGAFHEHCRKDRDNYIRVDKSNIDAFYWDQFEVEAADSTNSTYPYDYYSIMHYSVFANAKNKQLKTIIPINFNSLNENKIGQREYLSPGDISAANYLATRKVSPNIVRESSIHTGKICFKNAGIREADRDFNGGPKIEGECSLKYNSNKTSIDVEVKITLTENINASNPTKGIVTFNRNIFNCSDSFKIVTLRNTVNQKNIPMSSVKNSTNELNYFNKNGVNAQKQYFPFCCKEGREEQYEFDVDKNFIKKLILIADTPFRDISDDDNCKCDSKIIDIEFHPFEVVLKRVK